MLFVVQERRMDKRTVGRTDGTVVIEGGRSIVSFLHFPASLEVVHVIFFSFTSSVFLIIIMILVAAT